MAIRNATKVRRTSDQLVAALFVAALAAVPLAGRLGTTPESSVEREFRRPAPRPAAPSSWAEAQAWPRAFDAWYSDHFGLRSELIRTHNLVKMELFGVSPTSEIVLGPEHWMFTTRDRAVDVFRGADPFSERELELWAKVLGDRQRWCNERGIAYVFAIAPNKESVYPDKWPPRLDKIGPSRREQLVRFLGQRPDLPLVDLTDELLAARREFAPHDVYFQLGTHWNDRGALYAYLELMRRVAELVPGVSPRPRGDFRFVPTDFQDDSWAGRLYVEDILVQPNDELEFERAIPQSFWDQKRDERAFVIDSDQPDTTLPRAVMFHDSMGEKLRPLIAEHFSHVAFRWVSDFDTALIEAERPAVVIQLFVERALAAFTLSTSPMDTPEHCERVFGASSDVLYAGFDGLTPQPQTDRPVELARRADGALGVAYGGGGVLLPELEVPAESVPVLRIEVDAPAETTLLVEFLTSRHPQYSRLARGVTRPIARGSNVVWIELRVPDLSGRLRLHPGTLAGEYVLRSLEVRAVRD